MTVPAGVTIARCKSCHAPIWFGLVWGSPAPIDERTDPRYPLAFTGRRRARNINPTSQRWPELDDRHQADTRYRIHHCDRTRKERT